MRLESLRIKGLGPFRDELAIDLARDYAGAKLIAITGDNGAGKTTMLELGIPGAMFRQTPTRGTLVELATARDAMLEATLVNGVRHTIRHLVDGVSGKSEVVVLDAAGAPVLPDSKVRSFDGWAVKHLPTPEVLFASIFGAQGADGFLGMKPGERKAVLLRALGIERLEGLAELAREHAKGFRTRLETLAARMADERERQTGDAAAAKARAGDTLDAADSAVRTAGEAVAAAEDAALRVAELHRAVTATIARRNELAAAADRLRPKVDDLAERVTNNRGLLAGADGIRRAAERVAEIDAARADLARQRASITTGANSGAEEGTALADNLRAQQDAAAAKARGEQARARLANEGEVVAAGKRLPEAEAALAGATEAVAAAETALAELQGQRLAGADDRIASLRRGLEDISTAEHEGDDTVSPMLVADATLNADDIELEKAAKLPTELTIAKDTLAAARGVRASHELVLQELRKLAARADDVAAAHIELAAAIDAYKDAKARGEQAVARRDRARAEQAERAAQFTELDRKDEALDLELTPALIAKAALVVHLTTAEARLAELEPQLDAAQAELARLDGEVSATPVPEFPPPVPDVPVYKKVLEQREADLRAASAAAAVADQRYADEQASVARLAELDGQRAGLDDELADWNRLAADLGRDGLQASLIDAAIPELNHVANELLHEAFGPRFTVDVRTQVLDAKGKRTLETLDVVVIDTEKGREAQAETFSGGERVILQEALSLALTVIACRQSGVERPTLVRDESGAALSEGKAPQWVAMLRRAVDLIGAEHCLFVSHTPATWELADARIHLGGTT